jgi:hypothetical protein
VLLELSVDVLLELDDESVLDVLTLCELLLLLEETLLMLDVLDEVLLLSVDLVLRLDELDSSVSCRASKWIAYVTSPPDAPNRTMCDEASVTGSASECGMCIMKQLYRAFSVVGGRNAPPLATVSVGIHASLLLGSVALICNRPVPPVCTMMIVTISSMAIACPSASNPAPAPTSIDPRS